MGENYQGSQATVFVVLHQAMICHHGGLTFVWHNELRDLTASWLHEVCHDVAVEPPLQPLTGGFLVPASANCRYDAQADIHARGFGAGARVHFLISEHFTPTHLAIAKLRKDPCSIDTNLRIWRPCSQRGVRLFYTVGVFCVWWW